MKKLRVIKLGNPILRMKAKQVQKIDDTITQLVDDMMEIMQQEEGIGLAAPQIAQSIALLVIDLSLIYEDGAPMAFINPEIIESDGESSFEEGCLSLPDIREEVKRPEIITMKFTNIQGEIIEQKIDGLLARVLQHEMDHLDGKLFIDRISPLKKQLLKKKLAKIVEDEKQEID